MVFVLFFFWSSKYFCNETVDESTTVLNPWQLLLTQSSCSNSFVNKYVVGDFRAGSWEPCPCAVSRKMFYTGFQIMHYISQINLIREFGEDHS